MRKAIWVAVVILAFLHHDFWLWNDGRLLFGFLPIGLAYHVAFSILSAGLWAVASRYAWPDHVEEFAAGNDTTKGDPAK